MERGGCGENGVRKLESKEKFKKKFRNEIYGNGKEGEDEERI